MKARYTYNILQVLEGKDYYPYISKEELSVCENCEGYSEISPSKLSSLDHKTVQCALQYGKSNQAHQNHYYSTIMAHIQYSNCFMHKCNSCS